jgi:organic hydroperoxide reductase OsmC/OhrA
MSVRDTGNHEHRYEVRCEWSGATGAGYEAYDRTHTAWAPPATPRLELSADRAFRGDPHLLNPEQLLVLAAASCQLLSFLAVAARAHVEVLEYKDIGRGVMKKNDSGMSITSIALRPNIRVAADTNEQRVRRLVEIAHSECYVANVARHEHGTTLS